MTDGWLCGIVQTACIHHSCCGRLTRALLATYVVSLSIASALFWGQEVWSSSPRSGQKHRQVNTIDNDMQSCGWCLCDWILCYKYRWISEADGRWSVDQMSALVSATVRGDQPWVWHRMNVSSGPVVNKLMWLRVRVCWTTRGSVKSEVEPWKTPSAN